MKSSLLPVCATLLLMLPVQAGEEKPIRIKRPTLISIGLSNMLPGLNLQFQVTPQIAIGGHLGTILISSGLGLYGRWYFSEEPASLYAELGAHYFNSGFYQNATVHSVAILGHVGGEYRSPTGITGNLGIGLGLGTGFGNQLIDFSGLVSIDALLGYAF